MRSEKKILLMSVLNERIENLENSREPVCSFFIFYRLKKCHICLKLCGDFLLLFFFLHSILCNDSERKCFKITCACARVRVCVFHFLSNLEMRREFGPVTMCPIHIAIKMYTIVIGGKFFVSILLLFYFMTIFCYSLLKLE